MGTIREGTGKGGGNRATPSEAASYIEEIDRLEQGRENRLDQIAAEHKKQARALNKSVSGDIKAILADAKKVGVKKGVIRAIVDGQKQMRKHAEKLNNAKERAVEHIEELESAEHDYAVDILVALGDDFAGFGLGQAAVAKEKGDGKPAEPDAAGIAKAMEADAKKKAAGKDTAPKTH